jgi:dihydrofolate reductase
MRLSLIVAMDAGGMIGRDGALPWRLPEDLRNFKRITLGKPVVMGRRTWEAIGRPLPGRRNIVLTRDPSWAAEGVLVARSPDEALSLAGGAGELMVIGGADVYRLFLPRADRIYLTEIQGRFEGDTRFPDWKREEFVEVSREEHAADVEHAHAFTLLVLDRRRPAADP